jgi:hypothetical protein
LKNVLFHVSTIRAQDVNSHFVEAQEEASSEKIELNGEMRRERPSKILQQEKGLSQGPEMTKEIPFFVS